MSAALVLLIALAARTGTGDPAEIFRDKDPNDDLVMHGQLRLRTALYNNLDLGRGDSPTTGEPLFDPSAVFGGDARLRLTPSFFIGDELRTYMDLDVANASLGPAPNGVPWTPAHNAAALRFLDLRAIGVDWLLPMGVLSIGRMPSHFALGIAANDGAALDDDFGDRADRVAVVLPLYGLLFAGAFDVLDHALDDDAIPSIGEQAATVAFMKWRAPWEIELYRSAGRPVFDYGLALSYEWSSKSAPGPAAFIDASLHPDDLAVHRDAHLAVADGWVRFVSGGIRLEGEGMASDLRIEDPSTIAGVNIRAPIVGNPAAFALILDARLLDDAASGSSATTGMHASLEVGAASADPAPGFPFSAPPGSKDAQPVYTGAQPGDVFGPQVDLKHLGDDRFDSARIHPLHRIDLILWRTLLGGVSEAAYARARVEGSPLSWLHLDGNLVYSQALSADSAPGGAAPLGVEADVGAEAFLPGALNGASVRVDAGNLVPLGGLGVRGGPAMTTANWAQMMLVRFGYAL
jgi:uncharacterized protein (TIGR04551 family)